MVRIVPAVLIIIVFIFMLLYMEATADSLLVAGMAALVGWFLLKRFKRGKQ